MGPEQSRSAQPAGQMESGARAESQPLGRTRRGPRGGKPGRPLRVLIAKPGLDGHDRGAKVVALALRQAGFEVIYSGLHQTVDEIIEAASQEDVAVLGLSVLSGAHLPIAEKLMAGLQQIGFRPLVLFGGNIPHQDQQALGSLGVDGVFPTGSRFEDIVSFIHRQSERELRTSGGG